MIRAFLLLRSPLATSGFTPRASECPFEQLSAKGDNSGAGQMTADDSATLVDKAEDADALLERIGGNDVLLASVDCFSRFVL